MILLNKEQRQQAVIFTSTVYSEVAQQRTNIEKSNHKAETMRRSTDTRATQKSMLERKLRDGLALSELMHCKITLHPFITLIIVCVRQGGCGSLSLITSAW